VEILDLRHFRSPDLRPLLDEEARAWAQALSWDYSSSAEMILRYMDARILPGYAATENGRVMGYSFFVYEGSKGVIGDLFVHHDGVRREREQRANGVEEQLLGHVIETLQQSPGVHRIEAQLLLYGESSMARPFLEEGFRRYPRLFMTLSLNGKSLKITDFPDIEFRKWSEEEFQGAASVITAAYRDHIDSEINDQYRTTAGSMRFLNNIVRFPGCGIFDGQASLVARSKLTKATVGLILCSRVRGDVGHITQVCLLPEQRGRGLGRALIETTCVELRKQGCKTLSLTVTQANASAVSLYEEMGFKVQHVFDAFVWEG
jgi:ribosomal protein S18 acetylase RimI-like enzyme